jgi:hypothetical protein
MAITEAQRFEMHLGLRDKLGDAVANSLMEHLPPSGWSDVARTSATDRIEARIDNLEKRIDDRIDALEKRLETKMSAGFDGIRNTQRMIIGALITMTGAITAALIQISMRM